MDTLLQNKVEISYLAHEIFYKVFLHIDQLPSPDSYINKVFNTSFQGELKIYLS
jgi:hypothetical protein